ncbi:TorF family putative porin [Sphingomonas sp.]|uniref:TorF family putative porin n=1 Tax=Sphingomonas sp. TaxID=28214 RepID=UPI0025FE4338|nr:TorF family putative porin [Sphingomonas sp.]
MAGAGAAATALLCAAASAAPPRLSIEATSDLRARGLSWSDGRASLRAGLDAPIADGFSLAGDLAALRGAPRHGGADAGLDLAARFRRNIDGWSLSATAARRLFLDARGQDYWELGAAAGRTIGPALLRATIHYAPDQNAIGGDNLHLGAEADVAIPGTAFTLFGGLGHSSGKTGDAARAARLRPDGAYFDWRLGAEHVHGPLALGLVYTDTSITHGRRRTGGTAEHASARLAGYARLDF